MNMQISKEFIHQKYTIEGMTQKNIGELVGCSGTTILRRMREYDIPTRTKSEIVESRWKNGVYKNNANLISIQHKKGQRTESYRKTSEALKQYFLNPENRIRLQKENNPNWKGKISQICEICGKSFKVHPCHIEKGNGRYCSTECQGIWQARTFSGENSWNWRGGSIVYPKEFNKTFKKLIRIRDSFACRLCGKKETNRAHDVHHINYIKKDTTPYNCITLCINCHRKTNHNRKYWKTVITYLQQEEYSEKE